MATTEELIQQADQLNEAEKYQEVIDLLTDELLEERQSAELYTERARAYYSLKEYDKQWQDCEKAIVSNASHHKIYTCKGNYWYSRQEYDKALIDYNKAIQLKSDYDVAYNNRGVIWSEKGDHDNAIEDYNKTIQINPHSKNAFLNRGASWHYKGFYDKAIEDYNKAIELSPDYAFAFNNRGLALFDTGQYDKAIEDFDKAILLNSNNEEIFTNRGNTWSKRGQYNKAISDYRKAIQINSKYPESYYGLGLAYESMKKFNIVEAYLKKAYSLGLESKLLIGPFSDYFPNSFILYEALNKYFNLITFFRYQNVINICKKTCEKWLLFFDYCTFIQPVLFFEERRIRLKAIVNFNMGNSPNSYKIIESELENFGLTLQDQYYFINSANNFLEPDNGLAFAIREIENKPSKTNSEWYYAGQIYLLAQNLEDAEKAFNEAVNFIPALYALTGIYHQKKEFDKEKEIALKIQEEEKKDKNLSFLNGISPININKEASSDELENAFYNNLYYYELLEEINATRTILGINTPYHHVEFHDLPELDRNLREFIEKENERRDNENFFKEITTSYIKSNDEVSKHLVIEQCKTNPNIQDINAAIENAVKENTGSSFEQQIATRINRMKEDSIIYTVVIKHFYYNEKISPEEAILLHFFVLKKAMENNDKTLINGVNEELITWLPFLSDVFQSTIIVKVLMKAFSRIQNGREVYKMNYYKDYAVFKEKFITEYLPWWRDTIIKNELEKHQFTRKTDMDENTSN